MVPFWKSLAFWTALAYVVAALVAYFTPYKLEAGVLLAVVLAFLKLLGVTPELRAKGLAFAVPPFFYSLAFWQAAAYVIAALVAYFTPYKLEAAIVLAVVLAALKLFGIVPELRAKGLY